MMNASAPAHRKPVSRRMVGTILVLSLLAGGTAIAVDTALASSSADGGASSGGSVPIQ